MRQVLRGNSRDGCVRANILHQSIISKLLRGRYFIPN
jgi:hypothetical protein